MHHLTRFLLATGAVSAALFGGCATEEIPQYGDPANVIGGVSATGSGSGPSSSGSSSASSSSGACEPDAGCAVSFANDIFPILENKAKCSASVCHAPGASQLPVMTPGDAKATVQVLLTHSFNEGPDPYIVPCNPAASKMICNMKLETGNDTNPFGPDCLPRMPKVKLADDGVDDAPLSVDELNKIAEWIQCGALDN